MASYKITSIDKEKGVVELVATFDNGDTYKKRMMAPVGDADALKETIEGWLNTYQPMYLADKEPLPKAVSDLVGKVQAVSVKPIEVEPVEVEPVVIERTPVK